MVWCDFDRKLWAMLTVIAGDEILDKVLLFVGEFVVFENPEPPIPENAPLIWSKMCVIDMDGGATFRCLSRGHSVLLDLPDLFDLSPVCNVSLILTENNNGGISVIHRAQANLSNYKTLKIEQMQPPCLNVSLRDPLGSAIFVSQINFLEGQRLRLEFLPIRNPKPVSKFYIRRGLAPAKLDPSEKDGKIKNIFLEGQNLQPVLKVYSRRGVKKAPVDPAEDKMVKIAQDSHDIE